MLHELPIIGSLFYNLYIVSGQMLRTFYLMKGTEALKFWQHIFSILNPSTTKCNETIEQVIVISNK